MVGKHTSEAEVVPTVAVHGRYYLREILALHRALDGVFAIGRGAPFEVLSVVDVRPCEEDLISGAVSSEQLLHSELCVP
jgi:hypothetical protein